MPSSAPLNSTLERVDHLLRRYPSHQPPRECLTWLASLNLENAPSPRTLANGYVVAEIFRRYFPAHVASPLWAQAGRSPGSLASSPASPTLLMRQRRSGGTHAWEPFPMHSIENGHSTRSKQRNWQQLRRFMIHRLGVDLADSVVVLIINGHRALGWAIVCECWEILTGKQLPSNYAAPQLPAQPIFSHLPLPKMPRPAQAEETSEIRRASPRTYGFPTLSSVLHAIPVDVLKEAKDPVQRQAGLTTLIALHHDVTHRHQLPSGRVQRHVQCMERIPSPNAGVRPPSPVLLK